MNPSCPLRPFFLSREAPGTVVFRRGKAVGVILILYANFIIAYLSFITFNLCFGNNVESYTFKMR